MSEFMRYGRVQLEVMKEITDVKGDIADKFWSDTTEKYLADRIEAVRAKKEALAEEVAKLFGELTFYTEELMYLKERQKHFNGGENDGEQEDAEQTC